MGFFKKGEAVAKVVILGAGLTGLSTAYYLEKNGFTDFKIFDRESRPGGLLRSVIQDGFTFDHTGHFVHINDPEFHAFVDEVADLSSFAHLTRNTFVYSHDTYTAYPFQMNLYGLPTNIIAECIEGFVTRKKSIRQPRTFYQWVQKHFGNGLGKHFFFTYNRKILSYDLKKVHPAWTGRWVPNTTLEVLIRGAVTPPGISSVGYNSKFFYPKQGGIQHLINCLLAKITAPIALNHDVESIDSELRVITFKNGHKESYDLLVTTAPLDQLLDLMHEGSSTNLKQARRNLHCNSVLNYNLGINKANVSDKHWIYYPEMKYQFYRLGFWHTFAPTMAPAGSSSLYGELSYLPGTKTAAQAAEMVNRAKAQTLELFGVKPSEVVTEKTLHLKHAYVIYDGWRENNLASLHHALNRLKIHSIGRFGEWKYSSMQEAALDGKKMAEIITGRSLSLIPPVAEAGIQRHI